MRNDLLICSGTHVQHDDNCKGVGDPVAQGGIGHKALNT